MSPSMKNSKQINLLSAFLLLIAVFSSLLISETMAGKNKGGDDIILYNGNLVVRSGGGKGKGKGGSIVLANSPMPSQMYPMMDWGMYGRRR